MINKSKKHLIESEKTYLNHLKGAIFYGFKMIIGGIISIIHGLFPFLFDGITAKIIIDIYHRELKNHKNKKYQNYIKKHNSN
jgi:hypothetical protein